MGASISKIGTKYRVTLDHGKDEAGKRVRTFTTVDTQPEARQIATEFNFSQQRGLLVKPTDVTLAEHLRYWMRVDVMNNCQETTVYGYSNIIEHHVIPSIGRLRLQELQPAILQNYYQQLIEKGLSANTVRRHHALLKTALDFALRQQLVFRNVADAVTQPKKRPSVGKSYTPEEVQVLLDKVSGTRMEVPVYLAVFLGLRREEVTGLRWQYVDFKQRLIRIVEVRTAAGNKNNIVKEPKTPKSRRTLHLVDAVYESLSRQKEQQDRRKAVLGELYHDSDYVFVRDDGKPYRVNGLSEHFLDFLRAHNLPRLRFHDLRHTFASLMYNGGVDLKAISEVMGHSDIGTTSKIYTHLFDHSHREQLSAMSRILSST